MQFREDCHPRSGTVVLPMSPTVHAHSLETPVNTPHATLAGLAVDAPCAHAKPADAPRRRPRRDAFSIPSGLTGLFFFLWQPLAGIPEQLIVGVVGLFLLAAVTLAFRHIRAGRVDAHREWMPRGVAAALGIASVRLVAIPLDLALTPRGVDVTVIFALSLWLGWILSLAGIEWWTRSMRVQVHGAPRVAA